MDVDVAVIGAGVVGLASAYELQREGAAVVCFDPRPGAHQSLGPGRIFRLAHESPLAVEKAAAAIPGWRRWEDAFGVPLLRRTGCVILGGDAALHAGAMREAGAAGELTDNRLPPIAAPLAKTPTAVLVDREGGVIAADAVIEQLVRRVDPVRDAVASIESGPGPARLRLASGGTCVAGRVVVAAGLDGHRLGVERAHAAGQHVRFALRPSGPLAALDCAFLDRRRELVSGWSFYGLRLDARTIAVGGGGTEQPFDARDWQPEEVDVRSESELRAWLELRGEGSAVITGRVHCRFPARAPAAGAPYEIARRGNVVCVGGRDLFKFAPVIGRDVTAIASVLR